LKVEDYLETLPENILSGEDVQLTKKSFREIFRFVELGENDVFYHLGCNDETGIHIAKHEFNAKKAIGIDDNQGKIEEAEKSIKGRDDNVEFWCKDIRDVDLSDATVILFWFTDDKIIREMFQRFESLKDGTRIITIWGPLPDCLPDKVSFPYILNKTPFRRAETMQEQLLTIFGVKCVDFVTAWEFAERYTKTIGDPEIKNDRFLTIIQTLVIWINAKKLGVACGDEIPESIQTYINIMKVHFDIDFEYLLRE